MVSTLIGATICAPDSLSQVPFTLVSGAAVRFGAQATIDHRPEPVSPYAINLPFSVPDRQPSISKVDLSITTGNGTTTKTVLDRSESQPSLTDGGADSVKVWDWNDTFDMTAEPDGAFIVMAVIYDDQGRAKTLTPRTFYNNSGASITQDTVYVRNGGNDANDGSSVGNAVQTIARAQELISGHCFIDLGPGETYSELDMTGSHGAVVDGWVTFKCDGGSATLAGNMGTNDGLGLHKRWCLGAGVILEGRLSIFGGNDGGFWWLNGSSASTPGSNGNPTPNTGAGQVAHGLNTARLERWFATGFDSADCVQFNTGPQLARGCTQHDISGDMLATASRQRDILMYGCTFHTIFQAGGTHSDWTQSADGANGTAWPLNDRMANCFYQGMRIVDTEASFFEMSNDESPISCVVFENCVLHNQGLLANIGEGGITNVNVDRPGWNVLFRHCTFVNQSMRIEPIGKHRWVYLNCVFGDIDSVSTPNPVQALQSMDIEIHHSVWDSSTSTFDFGDIPGTGQVDDVVVFEDITTPVQNTGYNHTQQDYRLAVGSPGEDGAVDYQGKPTGAGADNMGCWDNAATDDWTLSLVV